MKTTGEVSSKKYKCQRCGYVTTFSTNHYGEVYPRCSNCSWKNPMAPQSSFVCLDPMPRGWAKPEPWKTVKLSDVAQIKRVRKKKKMRRL